MARLRLLTLLGALSVITAATINTAYSSDVEMYKLYMHMKVANDKEYRCLSTLWYLESKWNPKARNSKSSAFGIPQLLKMTETNPFKQIDLGIKYIDAHRIYKGDSCLALKTHKIKGHY
jgi:membrane-bound lytic murein transglycosylase MltF